MKDFDQSEFNIAVVKDLKMLRDQVISLKLGLAATLVLVSLIYIYSAFFG